ncbi:WS/DGAT domain-containing protein [Mycolicibacterium neoaurum]|uniref:WS/DGAT domain-containing protein n=1 Tax=Mycolicibacterium neoaurum TaxID=1795 RepID=UPI0026741A07|nr:WS/DGAT domain-containing protein [Mycolicibacterium neoaurum]MDO3403102.1 WS/DGAT domain-containing protein [Mycolicibacterium neoaurum]
MATDRLTAVDAQMFWMSATIPNDTFLLYAFDGVPDDLDAAIAELIVAARTSVDLTRRVHDESRLHYPEWVPAPVGRECIVTHLADGWADCLSVVVALVDDQLDARVMPWRIHLFVGIAGVPGIAGPATVAVLQITHALGGGGRTCAPAAVMFGRRAVVEPIRPRYGHPALLVWRSIEAARAHRELVRDGEMGRVPAPAPTRPPLRTNASPAGLRSMRTLVFDRAELAGATVTVAALSAISAALAAHLSTLGEDTSTLGAEVTMAKPGPRRAYNHFGTVGVGLHPDQTVPQRRAAIAGELADRRARAAHPAMRASDRAFAATPAPLLRWGVSKFDPSVRAAAVTGNTVVSSVNCGPADFAFGGRPVRMAAAFPGLSPMVGLTHCVTGVGDTIAISVFAAESAVGDVDEYLERLGSAFS